MAPGGICTKCEEPDTVELKDAMPEKTSRRAGGFLSQCCRRCSEGTSISVLFTANVVLFLLWIITVSIINAKHSRMAEEGKQLHRDQTQLHANDTHMEKQLEILHSTHSSYASKMNNSLQRLEDDQTKLRDYVTKQLPDLQTEKGKIWDEMYKLENALRSLNGCKMCPEGWLLNKGQCYYFHEQSMSWSSAEKFCTNKAGHLVIINDEEEQRFLEIKIKRPYYWIGLHDTKNENDFIWVDGSRPSYTNWASTQPDDYGSGEDCVHMRDNGQWNDLPCDTPLDGSICEKSWNCQQG